VPADLLESGWLANKATEGLEEETRHVGAQVFPNH
jgi:hypothetical protein